MRTEHCLAITERLLLHRILLAQKASLVKARFEQHREVIVQGNSTVTFQDDDKIAAEHGNIPAVVVAFAFEVGTDVRQDIVELQPQDGALRKGIAEACGKVNKLHIVNIVVTLVKVIRDVVGVPAFSNAPLAFHLGSHHFLVRLEINIAFINRVEFQLRIRLERTDSEPSEVTAIKRRHLQRGIHTQVGRIDIETFPVR